jgi:hypothetical protein
MVMALSLTACAPTGQPSKSQIENAKDKVAEIWGALFVPEGATLITKTLTYATNPRAYPGCTVGLYYASYEIQRGFNQVLEDCRDALVDHGWELSPDHQHGLSDFEALVSGSQTILTIASKPLILHLVPAATPATDLDATVYYIGLRYYDPSRHECSED